MVENRDMSKTVKAGSSLMIFSLFQIFFPSGSKCSIRNLVIYLVLFLILSPNTEVMWEPSILGGWALVEFRHRSGSKPILLGFLIYQVFKS